MQHKFELYIGVVNVTSKFVFQGFLEIDNGGRKIGIKEMGELNEKAIKAACFAKVPPEKVGAAFYKSYSSWQQQLSDLSWYPFKTVTIDGKHQSPGMSKVSWYLTGCF